MRVLFLDIDGVLWTGVHPKGKKWNSFDPMAVTWLNVLVDKYPDLKIVISSTWRYSHTLQKLKRHFTRQGFKFSRRIIDVTPQSEDRIRGHEIQDWLDQNPGNYRILILDDDSDMAHLLPRLVKTKARIGLTREGVDQAIELFKKDLAEPPKS